jgi:flagellar hook protein FlgE
MMPAMYAAVSGLEAHQTMLNVVANDLANVDTIGYKAERTTFVDELSQTLNAGSGSNATNGGTNPMQVGLGVRVGSIDNQMGEGSLQTTSNPLDIAIQGDGFLSVGGGTPPATAPFTSGLPTSLTYTRAGNLTTNAAGFLTTSSGEYVMGNTASGAGAPNTYINIPPSSTNVSIGQDGSVTYTSAATGLTVTAGYITLAQFPNEAGLQRAGGSDWTASANSGAASYGTPGTGNFGTTIAGSLEMSNVDMASEFTNMIQAQSGYEANSRVITTGNQMIQNLLQMAVG